MSVCRFCSGNVQLTEIFDPRLNNSEQLRFYFLLATGIQIREDDVVSKMVCHRCCEIAVKLHKYRANAVANDKLLKEQCGQAYVPPTTDQDELRRLSAQILTSNGKLFAAPYGVPPDGRLLLVDPRNTASHEALELLSVCVKSEPVENVPRRRPEPYKHDSVKHLYQTYPSIILPESVYNCDVAPVVTLDESEVEEWAEEEFKRVQQKLSWAKIIIQKVGECSTNDKSIEAPPEMKPLPNQLLIGSKRPGPKSRTLDVLPPPIQMVKTRPGPKSKTIDLEIKNKALENVKIVSSGTVPSPEVVTKSVLYRPGPKSRKVDLIIHSPDVKPIVHESQAAKAIVTSPNQSRLIKPQFKPDRKPDLVIHSVEVKHVNGSQHKAAEATTNSAKLFKSQPKPNKPQEAKNDLRIEAASTTRDTKSSSMIENGDADSDDDDFDPTSTFLENDLDDSSSSEDESNSHERSRTRSSTKQTINTKNVARRTLRSSNVTPSTHSDSDDSDKTKETYKTRSSARFDKTDPKVDVHSKRRASSVESEKSDTSTKRRKIDSSTNSKKDSKSKSKIESSSKSEVKSGVSKSSVQKSDESKGTSSKDDVSKKGKVEPIAKTANDKKYKESTKSLDKKESKHGDKKESKSVASDKKEVPSSSTNDKDSKSSGNDKKVLIGTPISQRSKTSTDTPSMLIAKAQKIYMCHTCCQLFETNKELSEHQKSHLICKYCNYRMKNLETLKKHQEENCRMNVNRLQAQQEPVTVTTKTDQKSQPTTPKLATAIKTDQKPQPMTPKLAAVIKTDQKLPLSTPKLAAIIKADQKTQPTTPKLAKVEQQAQPKSKITYKINQPKQSKPKSTKNKDEMQPTINLSKVDTIKSIVNKYPSAFDSEEAAKNKGTGDTNITASQSLQPARNLSIKTEIVCLSDESDDDIQCLDQANEVNFLPKSFLELPLSGMTENEMIRSLFTKHLKAGVLKLQRASQTFIPRSRDIRYTNSNLIVLEELFDELYSYKIPVQLEIRPKISARFVTEISSTPKASVESWAHIKTITICKPSGKPVPGSKPLWIAPAKFKSQAKANSQTPTKPSTPSQLNKSIIEPAKFNSPSSLPTTQNVILSSNSNSVITSQTAILPATQGVIVVPSSSPQPNTNVITTATSILPTTQALVVVPSSNSSGITTNVIQADQFHSLPSLLPKPQALVVQGSPSDSNTNTILLNNLLNSSPPVPSSSLLANSNLFLTTNNPLVSTINGPDKPPSFVSVLATSNVPTSNMTTTFIQTSNTATLFMQNGISPNSTTIIQTPNNATLIQTPNAAVIQTGNSNTFITPDSTTTSERRLLPKDSVDAPASTQSSMVLMQTLPQVTNQGIISNQTSTCSINTNNLIFQTPGEQIYQINNATSNVNKVVVFSNTLSNGLQQNMPFYTTPSYVNNLPPPSDLTSSVTIEEIEDDTHGNGIVSSTEIATNHNKNTLRIKPSWELY